MLVKVFNMILTASGGIGIQYKLALGRPSLKGHLMRVTYDGESNERKG